MLTDLAGPGTVVELPAGFDRLLMATAREVVVEVRGGGAQRVAVPAGSYTVRGWRGQEVRQMTLALRTSEHRTISAEELGAGTALVAVAKGGALSEIGAAGEDAVFAAGALGTSAALDAGGPLVGVRVVAGLRPVRGWRLSFAALASARSDDRETQIGAGLGYRWGASGWLASGRLGLWLGADLEGGVVGRRSGAGAGEEPRPTVLFTAASPGAGLTFALTRALALQLEAQVPFMFLGTAERFTPHAGPRAWAGLALGL